MSNHEGKFVTSVEPITSWLAFVNKVAKLDSDWIFRGDLESRGLVTSLERACNSWSVPLDSAPMIECRLLREFQRHPEVAKLDLDSKDNLGWYAQMQHYGTPTRLLDWTYSPFVAAHFAFDRLLSTLSRDASAPPERAAVWALNTAKLNSAIRATLKEDWELYQKRDSGSFTELYEKRSPPVSFVGVVNPLRLNERLSVQQGLFLCPGDVRRPWIENLATLWDTNQTMTCLVMDASIIHEAFKGLARMNVTARSLFPGLGGYAQSLLHRFKFLLEVPVD